MKRLLQSGAAVGLLFLLLVLTLINTAQLHNIESKLADGVPTSTTPVEPKSAGNPDAQPLPTGPCYISAEDEAAAKDPANLLSPWTWPEGYPTSAVRGYTLHRLIGQDPPGLNYYAANNAADASEIAQYTGARPAMQSQTDPDLWFPDLATKITKSEDGLTFDVYLRKGVLWQVPTALLADSRHAWMKGDHEVTADDFAFAVEILQNPQIGGRAAAYRTYYENWKPVEVVDPYHYRVHLTEARYISQSIVMAHEPAPRWLYRFDEDGKPFDDATWGEKFNTHWTNQVSVGAGPYRFVEWKPGEYISFEANPTWHNSKCQPQVFSGLEMKVLKDQQAWLRRLKAHELDYSAVQPQQYLSEIKDKTPYLGESHLKLVFHPEPSYFYIGWNQARPYFTDKRVRKALTMALDRQGLVDSVFAGLGKVTSGPFDQNAAWYDQSIAPLPYDPTAAAKLLDEAGWVDTDGDGTRDKEIDGKKVPFAFTLVVYGSSPEYDTLARVYAETLDKLGIKMTAQPLEWSAQLKKTNERDFDAYTGAWVLPWEVDPRQVWHSSEADKPQSSNYVSFKNAEIDQIIEELGRTADRDQRVALCHRFHAIIAEEQPYTFFYQRTRAFLYWDYMNQPFFSKINPVRDVRLFSFASAPTR